MYLIAAAAALALTGPSSRPFEKHRRHSTRTRSRTVAGRVTWNLLELGLRHEMLRDFLVESHSERPAFVDTHAVDAGGGLRIGPTSIDVDFLGAPVIRARVVNESDRVVDALVIVTIEDPHGTSARASTWIERLAPHADRAVELFCPNALAPASVHWSVTLL
ncbi:MAG: hypothetical protein ACHQY2_06410 [Candidatus Eremiobacterales bacterium]|jgi:hypothetical protein